MGSSNNSRSSPSLAQADLMQYVLPLIKDANQQYEKFQRVYARPAVKGETIVSITDQGEETTNTAKHDDMVVRNLTEAQEEYIVSKAKFEDRYSEIQSIDDQWTLYAPKGEVMAIVITHEFTDQLKVGEEFCIMAPWGSEQLATEGDMFVAPLPDLDEVYRIARKEFDETYRLKAQE